jgi:hypothetical protein
VFGSRMSCSSSGRLRHDEQPSKQSRGRPRRRRPKNNASDARIITDRPLTVKLRDLCVLTRVFDAGDAHWNEAVMIVDTLEGLKQRFDLSKGIPFGWGLLRGKKARRFLSRAFLEEQRYRRQKAAEHAMGGAN